MSGRRWKEEKDVTTKKGEIGKMKREKKKGGKMRGERKKKWKEENNMEGKGGVRKSKGRKWGKDFFF